MDQRIKSQMNVLEIIKMNIKSYRHATCFMEPDDNVLFFNYRENLDINLPIAKELVASRLEFTNNRKHYMVQHISNTFDIDYEAIQHLKDTENGLKNILGLACITSGVVSAQIAEILVKQPKKFPSKIFNTEKEAINWIHELKEYHRITQQ